MPGIPLVARETSSYSRSTDQMCREDSRAHLTAEEEIAAEESLSIYCKPVEFYNILQRRAIGSVMLLISIISSKMFELPNSRKAQKEYGFLICIYYSKIKYSAEYRFNRACILTNFTGVEGSTQVQANFILPDITKLALKAKSGSLAILLVNFAATPNSLCGIDLTKARLANDGGCCLWGKIPLESLYMSWEKSPNLSLGQRAEVTYPVDMLSCFLKLSCLNKDKSVSIQIPFSSGASNTSQQVHVTISAEEIGGKEKSAYNSYTCSDITSSSLARIIRLRAGNVVFNYRYYNNKLQRTEVTEDFSCPFCLVKCASFKVEPYPDGLRYHLPSSHDLFNFEFWVTEEYQAVNVSMKTDTWRSEVVADDVDPKQQTFFFCSKRRRHRRWKNLIQHSKHVHPLVLESNLPEGVCDLLDKVNGTCSISLLVYA
ncbi:hypothetical protein Pint_17160 [Pistacia integerrima]|uniref:Uncharacterized protein n=1 Tax=Pistacia integerrima TaxID=434235 RepID=A0ACC0YZU8_9ROSI|nr:hypothetical protein Pint_17160 [Pistacia integerrima]